MAVRAYHHGNLREELLDRAERMLAERGSDALSLRELAREVGVSHAAPRRHFADRQELLDALAERGFARLGRELRVGPDAADASFTARYLAVFGAYIRFATDDAALLDLMFAGKHRTGADAVVAASQRAFAVFGELVAQGQAAGAIAPGDPDEAGIPLFAALQGLAAMLNAGLVDKTRRDELVEGVALSALRGVGPS